jgi:hypothetical protein
MLAKCWGKGHCLVGDLTFESAAYVARYVVKKINGQQKFLHYAIINHETGEFHSLKQEYTILFTTHHRNHISLSRGGIVL